MRLWRAARAVDAGRALVAAAGQHAQILWNEIAHQCPVSGSTVLLAERSRNFYGYTPHRLDHDGQHQRSLLRLQLNPVGVKARGLLNQLKLFSLAICFFDLSGNVFCQGRQSECRCWVLNCFTNSAEAIEIAASWLRSLFGTL